MRTSVDIDDDLVPLLRAQARMSGRTFADVANEVLRDVLTRERGAVLFEPPVHDLGIRPGVDLTKAHRLVGQMADEEVLRSLERRL